MMLVPTEPGVADFSYQPALVTGCGSVIVRVAASAPSRTRPASTCIAGMRNRTGSEAGKPVAPPPGERVVGVDDGTRPASDADVGWLGFADDCAEPDRAARSTAAPERMRTPTATDATMRRWLPERRAESIYLEGKPGGVQAGELAERQATKGTATRSEEHTSELQSRQYLVCRLLLE